jgi:hypothetical protein
MEKHDGQGVERTLRRVDAVRNFGGMTMLLCFGILGLIVGGRAGTIFGAVVIALYVAYLTPPRVKRWIRSRLRRSRMRRSG